jgi:hypothetical protein
MVETKQYRLGETVEVILIQRDADSNVMSEVEVRWYGMANEEANTMTMDLVAAVAEKAAQWGMIKASAGNVSASPSEGKTDTGLISNR